MNLTTLWNNHKIKIMISLSIFINKMDIITERASNTLLNNNVA